MNPASFKKLSVAELVERFTVLCVGQYEAELRGEGAKENRLIREMFKVREELKARPGDQRSALLPLYEHPNIQVRLMAAKETLAIAPSAARHLLETIKASGQMPQSMDAGMSLWNLERGVFKPT